MEADEPSVAACKSDAMTIPTPESEKGVVDTPEDIPDAEGNTDVEVNTDLSLVLEGPSGNTPSDESLYSMLMDIENDSQASLRNAQMDLDAAKNKLKQTEREAAKLQSLLEEEKQANEIHKAMARVEAGRLLIEVALNAAPPFLSSTPAPILTGLQFPIAPPFPQFQHVQVPSRRLSLEEQSRFNRDTDLMFTFFEAKQGNLQSVSIFALPEHTFSGILAAYTERFKGTYLHAMLHDLIVRDENRPYTASRGLCFNQQVYWRGAGPNSPFNPFYAQACAKCMETDQCPCVRLVKVSNKYILCIWPRSDAALLPPWDIRKWIKSG